MGYCAAPGASGANETGNQARVGIHLSLCLIELVHLPLASTLSEAVGVSTTEEVNIVGAEGDFQLRDRL